MLVEIKMKDGRSQSIRAEDVRAILDTSSGEGCNVVIDGDPLSIWPAVASRQELTATVNEALANAAGRSTKPVAHLP